MIDELITIMALAIGLPAAFYCFWIGGILIKEHIKERNESCKKRWY